MSSNIFLVILLLQAYASSGEQGFLSQVENKVGPLELVDVKVEGEYYKTIYYTVAETKKITNRWDREHNCEDGTFACGVYIFFTTKDAKTSGEVDILERIDMLCCSPGWKDIEYAVIESSDRDYSGFFTLHTCHPGQFVTGIQSQQVDDAGVTGVRIECSDELKSYIGEGRSDVQYTDLLSASKNGEKWYVCGFQENYSGGALAGLGAPFCSPHMKNTLKY
jgi:hypothetical protein